MPLEGYRKKGDGKGAQGGPPLEKSALHANLRPSILVPRVQGRRLYFGLLMFGC